MTKEGDIKTKLLVNQDSESQKKQDAYIFDGLTPMVIWGYSMGHIFNDLCASSWFNFLLFYLTKVLGFEAGSYSMLAGQIADALGTPSAGILSDKYNTRFGKRIPWYFLSFILTLLSFLPMWCYPIISSFLPMENESFKTFFFILIPSVFNYFWAFGYIAHISLVPSLTCSRVRRDSLNTRRNTFTFIAQMLLLLIALFFFQVIDDSKQQFQAIGITCSVIGSFFCIFLLCTVKEVPLTLACNQAVKNLKNIIKEREGKHRQSLLLNHSQEEENLLQQPIHQSRKENINQDSTIQITKSQIVDSESKKEADLPLLSDTLENKIEDFQFSVGVSALEEEEVENQQQLQQKQEQKQEHEQKITVRLSSVRSKRFDSLADHVVDWNRLFCNVTTTMMNFYLYFVIKVSGEVNEGDDIKLTFQLALIPLLLYIASVGASSILNKLYLRIGRKKTFSLGVLIMLISIGPLSILNADNSFLKNLIYPIALGIGAAQALQLNTAINLISEVIGLRGSGGAFVFGAYSFVDKMVTGIVLFVITNTSNYKENDPDFIRWVIVIIPIISSLGAWVLILLGNVKDYDTKNQKTKLSRMSLGDEFVQ